jgi:hypothetical protein
MAGRKAPSILAGYFNVGEGKRPLPQFAAEVKALSDAEKAELVRGVCAVTGETVPDEYAAA